MDYSENEYGSDGEAEEYYSDESQSEQESDSGSESEPRSLSYYQKENPETGELSETQGYEPPEATEDPDAIDIKQILEESKKRVTMPYMTKYEKTRIIGYRATQISNGSPPCINTTGMHDSIQIAHQELIKKCIPVKIKRFLPDGTYEIWDANELCSDHLD
jgi:DNA-directed RNA polymerase I, II, and III subunit RPABC2